nr:hypothetical protein [Tanacetum cinerariifolium]
GIEGRIEAGGLAFVAGGQRLIRLGALHLGFDEVRNLVAILVYPGVGTLVAPEVVEGLLQQLHALVHRLFGVLLHARVDGGVHLQAIAVEVVAALQHHVAALGGGHGVKLGVKGRGVVKYTDEHGGLLGRKAVGRGAEEGFGRHLNTEGVRTILHRVEIHPEDFLLGVAPLQLHGGHPLFGLIDHRAHARHVAETALVFTTADFIQ